MTREEARKAAEVMLAYADGKEIEDTEFGLKWEVDKNPQFNWLNNNYRIKPTPTYRPFANAEECWEEMKKHEPFGWVKDKDNEVEAYSLITLICNDDKANLEIRGGELLLFSFKNIMNFYTFADGSVFGKLTEKNE